MVVRESVDYLAIGHVTRDLRADASFEVGGTVSYAALTAAALGRSAAILTSAAPDFDFSVFDDAVAVQCNCVPHTTTFQNFYTNGTRQQIVYDVAGLLVPDMVPPSWRSTEVVHIGPVMGECDPSLAYTFSSDTFLGITAQGWMRSHNSTGYVTPHAWRPADALLDRASAVVFSLDDVRGDWRLAEELAARTRILVVTLGIRGGVLFHDGVTYPFPALKIPEIDPTGAGDIFGAVFFCKLAAGLTPSAAARYAACVASRSVERKGIESVPGSEDLIYCDSLFSV